MSITTRSSFFYGHTVDDFNNSFGFKESASELIATLAVGEYTLTTYAVALANAMTTAGTQTYSYSVDRTNRTITLSATSVFSLLVSSGATTGAFDLMGFTGADVTGSNSYEGNVASGDEYRPQFLLQKYIATKHYKETVGATVNESASGAIQVTSYGTKRFMECNITFITNIDQGSNNPIETNLSGVEDLEDFMNNITGKTKIEFMEDRDAPSTYESLILESAPRMRTGTGFKLNELYSRKLPNYYETGTLKFRKITE